MARRPLVDWSGDLTRAWEGYTFGDAMERSYGPMFRLHISTHENLLLRIAGDSHEEHVRLHDEFRWLR